MFSASVRDAQAQKLVASRKKEEQTNCNARQENFEPFPCVQLTQQRSH